MDRSGPGFAVDNKKINGRTGTIEIPRHIHRGIDRYSGYDGLYLGPERRMEGETESKLFVLNSYFSLFYFFTVGMAVDVG
jgi:hypothetical protein